MNNRYATGLLIALVLSVASVAIHAQSEAKKKGWIGAGIGALAGGIIGRDAGGAAVGALAGGGIGYLVGKEGDKKKAEAQAAAEQKARSQAKVTENPQTAYKSPNTNQFVGSTWQVVSLVSEGSDPEYASMVVNFPSSSKITTMAVTKDGKAESTVEQYRIVEDAIVITGKDADSGETYVNSFKFSVDGDQLIAVSPESRVVLQRVQ